MGRFSDEEVAEAFAEYRRRGVGEQEDRGGSNSRSPQVQRGSRKLIKTSDEMYKYPQCDSSNYPLAV